MTDPSKFTSLFVKYERRLYSIIASMLGHPAEAEDLLQETAKVLWKKFGDYDPKLPFRLYKHFVHEGGAATPFFMHWPNGIKPGKDWYREPAQLIDVVPTILDLAGADYPKTYKGNDILPIDGLSLRPAFSEKPLKRGKPFFVEHENNAFVRDGKWKLVGRGVSATNGVVPTRWELYDIEKDRTETNNLAATHPDKAKEMAGQWDVWAKRVMVYPKNKTPPKPTPCPILRKSRVGPSPLLPRSSMRSPKGWCSHTVG